MQLYLHPHMCEYVCQGDFGASACGSVCMEYVIICAPSRAQVIACSCEEKVYIHSNNTDGSWRLRQTEHGNQIAACRNTPLEYLTHPSCLCRKSQGGCDRLAQRGEAATMGTGRPWDRAAAALQNSGGSIVRKKAIMGVASKADRQHCAV